MHFCNEFIVSGKLGRSMEQKNSEQSDETGCQWETEPRPEAGLLRASGLCESRLPDIMSRADQMGVHGLDLAIAEGLVSEDAVLLSLAKMLGVEYAPSLTIPDHP